MDEQQAEAIKSLLLEVAENDKANDVEVLPLPQEAGVGICMIVLSGTSNKHTTTIAEHMLRALKKAKIKGVIAQGMETGDWIALDAMGIIVHIFRPEVRAYYDIESLWKQQPKRSKKQGFDDAIYDDDGLPIKPKKTPEPKRKESNT